ncbi:WhiB family transcriptional regulator [Salininema proteolyticum]|uniref:Transcriptional regulator WhiB n=1 Tax=Salininema proteolyticum TaxID=1607685 RepID=A0ABV8TXS7_9ACTN
MDAALNEERSSKSPFLQLNTVAAPSLDEESLRADLSGPELVAKAASQGGDLPCREYDADLWFSETPHELEFAKSLCADCPVRLQCLAGAVERSEPWGVWGGEIFERGTVIARKKPRGRPRKNALELEEAAEADLARRSRELELVGAKVV